MISVYKNTNLKKLVPRKPNLVRKNVFPRVKTMVCQYETLHVLNHV